MSSQWGTNLKISIFGESHGKGIGVILDGVPPGIKPDMEEINFQMGRRAPAGNRLATKRQEKDTVEILSGIYNGYTTGTPVCAVIYNSDTRSEDYGKLEDIPRPGHADYTGKVRYRGYNDHRGGGHFSGRLTAPLVFAGALAEQMLKEKGIVIGAYIKSIADVESEPLDLTNVSEDVIRNFKLQALPVLGKCTAKRIEDTVSQVRSQGDSVGGEITCVALGVPAGIGSPIFDALESKIASLVFSVPAVKGISFGAGFDITKMKGTCANDPYRIKDGKVVMETNNNGGILGGITVGMPIIFTTAIKPVPSIYKPQKSVNLQTMEDTEITVKGRHDPCIVPRAVPVIEACCALCLVDAWMDVIKWR